MLYCSPLEFHSSNCGGTSHPYCRAVHPARPQKPKSPLDLPVSPSGIFFHLSGQLRTVVGKVFPNIVQVDMLISHLSMSTGRQALTVPSSSEYVSICVIDAQQSCAVAVSSRMLDYFARCKSSAIHRYSLRASKLPLSGQLIVGVQQPLQVRTVEHGRTTHIPFT